MARSILLIILIPSIFPSSLYLLFRNFHPTSSFQNFASHSSFQNFALHSSFQNFAPLVIPEFLPHPSFRNFALAKYPESKQRLSSHVTSARYRIKCGMTGWKVRFDGVVWITGVGSMVWWGWMVMITAFFLFPLSYSVVPVIF